MRADTRIVGLCLLCLYWAFLRYTEKRQWWSLRMKLSAETAGGWPLIPFSIALYQTIVDISAFHGTNPVAVRIAIGILIAGSGFLVLDRLLPFANNAKYLLTREKAWSGPSRTGIAPAMVRYLGNKQDWRALDSEQRESHGHPVEAGSWLYNMFDGGIRADPAELLRARYRADEEADTVWIPRSDDKESVYAPVENGRPASLLWGSHLGFARRCSRGIIAVPSYLLTYQPRLKNGVDGRPLCLAHGILARNKGLEPQNLVCGLQSAESRRIFEENSSLWPLPSKTLYTVYQAEMTKSFAGLGANFVAAATQLALLLADTRTEITWDWLEAQLEHQDLSLNRQIAALGASVAELSRLYYGQYVAMLVSLSEHRRGVRIRPELSVYKELLNREGFQEEPFWLSDASMVDRLREESVLLGERGRLLIEAAL